MKPLWVVFLAFLAAPAAAQSLVDAAAARLGFDAEAVQRLMQGEVVIRDLSPTSKRELAATSAILIHAPFKGTAELLRTGEAFNADPDNEATMTLADRDTEAADLAPMSFGVRDLPEVHALFHAKPGEANNLSADEAVRFRALRKRVHGPEDQQDALEAQLASGELRSMLSERINAYRKNGLKGTPLYARDDGQTDPGAELARAAAADRTLGPEFDTFRKAALEPQVAAAGVESRFLVQKTEVEQRAEFVLNNLLFNRVDQGGQPEVGFVLRQFYVLHSYNAAEITGLCIPSGENACVIFYSSRSSTDQLTGFGEQARRNIGQSKLRDDLAGFLRGLRERAESAGAAAPGK